jgi:hypothetical protein
MIENNVDLQNNSHEDILAPSERVLWFYYYFKHTHRSNSLFTNKDYIDHQKEGEAYPF